MKNCRNIEVFRTGKDSANQRVTIPLVREILVTIRINGRREGSVSATPRDLKELACGWALTEGYIRRRQSVKTVLIDEEAGEADVRLAERTGDSLTAEESGTPEASSGIKDVWTGEDLAEAARRFRVDPPLHRLTRAAHSCMILRRDKKGRLEELWRSEDAGRHSALDKAIGWAFLHREEMGRLFLMTSGRISTRMVMKAVCAGIGMLAGKGTATAEAVQLARENRMGLAGYVTEEEAVRFSPEGDA